MEIAQLDKNSGGSTVIPLLPTRRVIFISHATTEDNLFAGWLAAQLAIAGYEVWCDLTKLLGGEAWWKDIDEAIDAATFRFLFVSTLEGNRKPGTLRELRLAFETQEKHNLKDFIIPLKIDEFPFEAMNEKLQGLNCPRFDGNWATGLAKLLKLLEREGAPKSPEAGPACVTDWYRRSIDQNRQIVVSNNKHYSNWYPLTLPERIHFHQFKGPADALEVLAESLPFPCKPLGSHLITFAPLAAVEEVIGPHFSGTQNCGSASFIEAGFTLLKIEAFDASNMMSDLVRQAWESTMTDRGFAFHESASGYKVWFFKEGKLSKNRGYYEIAPGKSRYRQLVGRKSRKKADGERVQDGFWHFAVSARPMLHKIPRMVLNYHVIFTDDGETPWPSPERMLKARRSVCKQWWNPEWRDRLRAFTSELGGKAELALPVGGGASILVSMQSLQFTSPWTYYEDRRETVDETVEVELVEEEGGDDEE